MGSSPDELCIIVPLLKRRRVGRRYPGEGLSMLHTSFRRRAIALAASAAFMALSAGATLAADVYQTPPAPIAQILESPQTPSVAVSPDRKVLAQLGRENLPATARKVTEPVVNAVFGGGYDWLPDGSGLLVQTIIADRGAPPVADETPTGPTIQESKGRSSARSEEHTSELQ